MITVEQWVPDRLWELARATLPTGLGGSPGRSRQRADDRAVLAAILYVAATGCHWRQLPPTFGVSWQTVRRRLIAWTACGVWPKLHRVVLAELSRASSTREALVEGEERFRAIFDWVGTGIATIDLGARIVDANPAFCQLLGYRASELRGMPGRHLLPRGEIARHAPLWDQLAAGQRRRYQIDGLCVGKDLQLFLARVTVSLVRGADATPALTVCLVDPHVDQDNSVIELPRQLRLSAIDIAILERLSAGLSNHDIATELQLSRQTIDYHLVQLRRKLNARSRGALPARAYALGLFQPGYWPPKVTASLIEPDGSGTVIAPPKSNGAAWL